MRYQSSPEHHSIHYPLIGQLCGKPSRGTRLPPKHTHKTRTHCPPNSCPAPPPGSAHPSPGKARRFPGAEPGQRVLDISHLPFRPPLWEPTRRSRARGQEAGRAPPKSAFMPGPAPFPSFHLPSFLPAPVPAPPEPPAPSISSAQKEETSFWAKFRSEQERLSLPCLPLTPALRNH